MSRPELTPFSHAVMTLVGRDGAGPHDLRSMMLRGGRLFWSTGESLYYSEPKRLATLGYLTAEKAPGKTRERTHYRLTDQGRDALRVWAAAPTAFPRIQNELVLKAMSLDLVGEDAVLEGLRGFRRDLDAVSELVAQGTESADSVPHRARILHINNRYAHRLIELHREWADELEREIEGRTKGAVRDGA